MKAYSYFYQVAKKRLYMGGIFFMLLFGANRLQLAEWGLPQRIHLSPGIDTYLWSPFGVCKQADMEWPELELELEHELTLPLWGSDYLQGIAELASGNSKQAEPYLMRAYRQRGNSLAVVAIANHLLKEGQTTADEMVASWPNSDEDTREVLAHYYLGQAAQCHLAGHKELAWRYLDLGIALLPTGREASVSIHLSRRIGEIYYYSGDPDQAEPWLWQAAPGGDSSLILLARILHQQARYEEAIPMYIQALRYYPYSLELRMGGAEVAEATGDLQQARDFLEGMQPIENLGLLGLLKLAQLCRSIDDFPCVEEQYQRVLQIDPVNEEALQGLGNQ